MWSDLEKEMGAIKREFFGSKYIRLRKKLKDASDRSEASLQKWRELQQLENTFLYLISYIAADQDAEGWWGTSRPYRPLMTAHVIRLFSKMGVTLKDRWNFFTFKPPQGNLFRAVKKIVSSFHKPGTSRYAMWGDDIWDDCQIMLALLYVRPQLADEVVRKWDDNLEAVLEERYSKSLDWLKLQAKDGLANVPKSDWYGPGFYAAMIALIEQLSTQIGQSTAKSLINSLVKSLRVMLEEKVNGATEPGWGNRYAWHIGQLVISWKENRDKYESLKTLDPLMKQLYEELKARQSADGTWDNNGEIRDREFKIYYTVRALAACYVMESSPDTSETIRAAHRYLIDAAKGDTPLIDQKGCINAIDAFDKLFDFRIPSIHLGLLVSVTNRLNSIGLLKSILNPEDEEVETLRNIRAIARRQMEDQGELALEMVGVNDRLYHLLRSNRKFLNEFVPEKNKATVSDHQEIRTDLQRFLSSTMTEVRSNLSRKLIQRMWHNFGFLNFIPLIQHLSDLEHDRAFFRFYRDHLNHEVLLYLLGSAIYFHCPTFRDKLNEEIRRTYIGFPIPPQRDEDLADEFLFRWKMVSTFHDIGYLFEVEPDVELIVDNEQSLKSVCDLLREDEANDTSAAVKQQQQKLEKEKLRQELLNRSFGVIEAFRRNFLFDYLMQYTEGDANIEKPDEREKARQKKVCAIVEGIKQKSYKDYQPELESIAKADDLFNLLTAETPDAFEMISSYIKDEDHIGPDLIRNYFELCRTTDSQGDLVRSKFHDHGIMSALVLLKTADIQRFHLQQLTKFGFKKVLKDVPELLAILSNEKTKTHVGEEQFYIRFSHVAGAIALHNIYPHMYTKEQCQSFDAEHAGAGLETAFHAEQPTDKGRYAISIEKNPLAYLTALADVLQDWDRHSFGRPTFAEVSGEPLSSSEVVIRFLDNKIHVTALSQRARERYGALTGKKGLDQYLLDWRSYLTIDGL